MQHVTTRIEPARDPRHLVLRANPIQLSPFTEARREPTRPPAFRGETFEREFDYDTLIYDAFDAGDGRIALLGPPLFNLAKALGQTRFRAGAIDLPSRIRKLDRHAQIWLTAPDGVTDIAADGPLGRFDVPVSPNGLAMFRDRRAIFTMSKNNPIEWILDWVRFNRDVHGADAVLVYDNGSTAYDCQTLSAALATIQGIACSVVMDWPFKFGPQGTNTWDHWDSDFGQLGAWEHARWRFLQHARSAIDSDIDELVVSRSNRSVFEVAEQSRHGLVRYAGRWVIGTDGVTPENAPGQPLRHRDFTILRPPKYERSRLGLRRDVYRCMPKWTVVPRRCPAYAQWRMHSIASWWPSHVALDSDFSFRHFQEIGSNWRYQRINREPFNPAIHIPDDPLIRAFAKVDWDA